MYSCKASDWVGIREQACYHEVLGDSTRCYRLVPPGLSAFHRLLAIFRALRPVAGSHQFPVTFFFFSNHVLLGLKFPFYKDASHVGWGPPTTILVWPQLS